MVSKTAKMVGAFTYEDKPITKPLLPVMNLLEKLNCQVLNFRWSYNGVPHIVLKLKSKTYSVCYFGREKIYRVFHPYPSGGDAVTRHNCKCPEEVISYLTGKRL